MNNLKKCAVLLGIIKEPIANFVISYLSDNEKEKIFDEIEKGDKFTKKEKNKVLLEFLDFFKQQKKPVLSFELITLGLIFLSVLSFAALYFFADKFNRAKIEELTALFTNMGVIYVITYPYLSVFVRKHYGKSPVYIAFKSKKPLIDIFIGFAGAIVLFLLLALINRILDTKQVNQTGIFYVLILTQGFFAHSLANIWFYIIGVV